VIIEIIISIFLGIITGIITGLIPGVHINLIGTVLLFVLTNLFLEINPLYLSIFIVCLSISNIFIEFIPSIFLGCPDTENQLSILPGHEMLKQGRGYEAVKLTSLGAVYGAIILLLLFIPFSFILSKIYPLLSPLMFWILFSVFVILILLDKKRILSIFIFLISGLLGILILNLEINEPLLPLFTGLFGCSTLIISLKDKIKIPIQKITIPKIKKRRLIISSLFISPICGFLPGLGSGQSSILVNILAKTDRKGFLFLNGLTNILVMGFSFISLSVLAKTRTGSAVLIESLIGIYSWKILFLFMICIFISSIICFFITDKLSKKFCKIITKIDYSLISIGILVLIFLLTLLFSGIIGIIILIASTLLGIYCSYLGVRKSNLMGCLLIPTMSYYFLKLF
jgi:putative membrane protein